MTHILKNKHLEIHIDMPLEQYKGARFDWTGKIVKLKFHDMDLCGVENPDCDNEDDLGKGFYNEFGIDFALGFEEAPIGGWFHKIGIGLLKKEDDLYHISKRYTVQPATFNVQSASDSLVIECTSEILNGYGYVLRKTLLLEADGFRLQYHLKNTGSKKIVTDEYVHNFTIIGNDPIGSNYKLDMPFQLQPALFEETVNPEDKVILGDKGLQFRSAPKVPFFFSNLSGFEMFDAHWQLTHNKSKLRLSETGDFKTNKMNIWGAKHVICPELFFKIDLKPGASVAWSRCYAIYNLGLPS